LPILFEEQAETIVNIKPSCPWCLTPGQQVMIQTVKNLCENSKINEDDHYYLCLSPDYASGYFSQKGEVIPKNALSVPIWFKEKLSVPVYYCQHVTDQQVWEHVLISSVAAVLRKFKHTREPILAASVILKNPAGR